MWRSGACQAVLLHKCLVGIACYGSSAVSAQLSEQCVRRTASQRERGLTALPAQKCGHGMPHRKPCACWGLPVEYMPSGTVLAVALQLRLDWPSCACIHDALLRPQQGQQHDRMVRVLLTEGHRWKLWFEREWWEANQLATAPASSCAAARWKAWRPVLDLMDNHCVLVGGDLAARLSGVSA